MTTETQPIALMRYLLGTQQAMAALAMFADIDGITIDGRPASAEIAELLGDGEDALGVVSELIQKMAQIERLSREADAKQVNLPAMLGDIARSALTRVKDAT